MNVSLGALTVYLNANLDNFDAGTRRAHANVGKLKDGIANFATAATAAISGFAAMSVYEFAKEEDAINNLNAALANNGDNVEKFSQKYQAFAEQIQSKTIFGHESILEIMTYGRNVGIVTGELEGAANAAVGLAAKYNLDLNTAMELIGKAWNGNTDRLKRYGIILDDNLTKEEKYRAVVALGTGAISLAEARTKTFNGSIAQLKNNFFELQENIGGVIAKDISGWITALNGKVVETTKWFKDLDIANQSMIIHVGELTMALITLEMAWKKLNMTSMVSGGFSLLISYSNPIKFLAVQIFTITEGFAALTGGGMLATVGITVALTAGFVALAAGIGVAFYKIGEFLGSLDMVRDYWADSAFMKWLAGVNSATDESKAIDKKIADSRKQMDEARKNGYVGKGEGKNTDEAKTHFDKMAWDEEWKEWEKFDEEIAAAGKKHEKDILDAKENYDKKVEAANYSQLDNEGKINFLIEKRAEIMDRMNGAAEDTQYKMKSELLDIDDNIKSLQDSGISGAKFEPSKQSAAIQQGTVEAYRAELAAGNQEHDYSKRTADNTLNIHKEIQGTNRILGNIVELGVA